MMLRSFAVLTVLGSALLVSAGQASADGSGSDATKAAKVYMPAGKPVPGKANSARTAYRSFSYSPSNNAPNAQRRSIPTQFRADRKIRSGNTN